VVCVCVKMSGVVVWVGMDLLDSVKVGRWRFENDEG
jgi:hypothetical protein